MNSILGISLGVSENFQFLLSQALGRYLSKLKYVVVKTQRKPIQCKTLRSNSLNSDTFPKAKHTKGQSLGTVCGQVADIISHLIHWADLPGLWDLRSYMCHEYETGPMSPFLLIFVLTYLCSFVAMLTRGSAGKQVVWSYTDLWFPFPALHN